MQKVTLNTDATQTVWQMMLDKVVIRGRLGPRPQLLFWTSPRVEDQGIIAEMAVVGGSNGFSCSASCHILDRDDSLHKDYISRMCMREEGILVSGTQSRAQIYVRANSNSHPNVVVAPVNSLQLRDELIRSQLMLSQLLKTPGAMKSEQRPFFGELHMRLTAVLYEQLSARRRAVKLLSGG